VHERRTAQQSRKPDVFVRALAVAPGMPADRCTHRMCLPDNQSQTRETRLTLSDQPRIISLEKGTPRG
jgi:hypothetical protein